MELENNSVIECDIAIIGAGMAGICLAEEFKNSRFSVGVFESGGEEPDDITNSLNCGTCTVHSPSGYKRNYDEYIHESRERYLGGTGNAWGGKCAQLEPFDFEQKQWIEHSGWPISYSELKPYYNRACYLLHIPTFDKELVAKNDENSKIIPINSNRNFTTSLRSFSGVTGKPLSDSFTQFKQTILNHSNTKTYLYANITSINANNNGQYIMDATIKCINNKKHLIKANQYILAAGGIENARILLSSNSVNAKGLGNDNDLVGRFFNGHAVFRYLAGYDQQPSFIRLAEPIHYLNLYTDKDPTKIQGVFSVSQKAQWRERICNFTATLDPSEELSKDGIIPVFFMTEQFPNQESRIRLSTQHDALGIPRVHIDWHFTQDDINTLNKGIKLFMRDIEKSAIGASEQCLLEADIVEIMESSRHHLGCTRMHESEQYGVLDQNLRVHGVDNLYVVGSSAFPTGGVANPTLTILALAIRLGDHIKNLFKNNK